MTGRSSGPGIVTATLATTGLFTVTQVAAVVEPTGAVGTAAVIVSLACLTGGSAAFLVGFLGAVARSRDETVPLAGLIWLVGVAPAAVAVRLRGALVAQVAVALATAAIRPFTAVAFGILAPMAGLGALVLWSGRHGTFAPLPAEGGAETVVPPVGADPERVGGVVPPGQPSASAAAAPRDGDPDDFDQLFRRRKRRGG